MKDMSDEMARFEPINPVKPIGSHLGLSIGSRGVGLTGCAHS